MKALNKLFSVSSLESTYISSGYTNWKDATAKFAAHDGSNCHKEAVLKMVTLSATTHDIAESLSAQVAVERLERCQCFLKLLSNIRFLARQALPLRGDRDESDSKYIQLFKLRGEDDARVFDWLRKKTDKYTSADMQNEMLKVMAMQVLREVVSALQNAVYYTVMVDETTDVSNREQVVLCFCWVDNDFNIHEDFVGMYTVESIDADTLVSVNEQS